MRKAIAWAEIAGDKRLQDQLPPAQMRDATEKAKGNREGAAKAVRLAWSHVLFPVKAATAGVAFDLDHLSIASKDRAAIPFAVYEKAGPRGDGIAKERLGPDALALHLNPLWPDDRPHLGIAEVADWFASYAYLPKLRDRVVLEAAIRDAVGKLDPAFGYADSFDGRRVRRRSFRLALCWSDRKLQLLKQARRKRGLQATRPLKIPPHRAPPSRPLKRALALRPVPRQNRVVSSGLSNSTWSDP